MSGKAAKKTRKELRKIYEENAPEMFKLFIEGMSGKRFRIRVKIAWALVRGKSIPWSAIKERETQ